jgi:hypothetical protein
VTAVRFLVWAAGAALCATLAIGATLETWPRHETAIITYSAAFAAISIGVVAWQLRPDTRIGILLTGWAFAGVLSDLQAVFRGSAAAAAVRVRQRALRSDLQIERELLSSSHGAVGRFTCLRRCERT